MSEALLQVRDLTVEFGAHEHSQCLAVDTVSFDVARSEIVGLAGESGCGKTTLALGLLGLLDRKNTVVSGSALFQGNDLLAFREDALQKIRGAKISLISQEPRLALCPVRRTGEQVAEILHAHSGLNWRACRSEAESWLDRIGLQPTERFWAAYPHQLSSGQLQRIVLAQALICKPELLIADEPTAALDAQNQSEFIEMLRRLKAQMGISVLLISHAPEIHASLADRVLVMKDGRIVEQGELSEIFRNPKDAYTRAMLGAISRTKMEDAAASKEYVAR